MTYLSTLAALSAATRQWSPLRFDVPSLLKSKREAGREIFPGTQLYSFSCIWVLNNVLLWVTDLLALLTLAARTTTLTLAWLCSLGLRTLFLLAPTTLHINYNILVLVLFLLDLFRFRSLSLVLTFLICDNIGNKQVYDTDV